MGKLLRKLRQARGLSLSELAKEFGVTESYLCRLETEENIVPSLPLAARMEAWDKRLKASRWVPQEPPSSEAQQCA